ncbi:MAG: purine-nucleoside phosphorylase [Bacteroidales bacterium]|nr:purine-nucleoside phosphorylase [Bacteroidales bacterium]
MENWVIKIKEAAEYIKGRINENIPEIGVILGSGLGRLADTIENPTVIPYSEIPNFPMSTAIGHKGNFIFGNLGGKYVCAMQGRFHYYEGHEMHQVTLPVRVMILLGIKYLFVSNAAGGVNPAFKVGDIMLISDHINMLRNPLIGRNLDDFGPRFPDMTRPYDRKLIRKAEEIAHNLGINIHKGVYFASSGPSYETPAEYKFYRLIGADAVGMSTIPEVIVARHSDVPVFGVSIITNEAHDFSDDEYVNDGEDVIKAADEASEKMILLFRSLITTL